MRIALCWQSAVLLRLHVEGAHQRLYPFLTSAAVDSKETKNV